MFFWNKKKEKVVTRFAPSPTGLLHVGSARTALFNYLYAKKNEGKFILRIEDTDIKRNKKEYEDDIIKGLSWLSLKYDELYRQSERMDVYKKYLEKIIESGNAYEAEENEHGTGKVIRFKNTNERITFNDLIRGEISFDTAELGDFVIAKDMSTPLYHFAVVVDDFDMGITHIIRGEDGISNTPRQILIGRALGAPEPKYAHIPLILAPDKSKLSKRNGAVSVNEYKEQGYIPEAMDNFLALIGWNPGTDKEIFSLSELVKEFDLSKVQKRGAVFNQEKLDWVNKEHIKKLPYGALEKEIRERLSEVPEEILKKLIPIISERINKWSDIEKMKEEGELDYFFNEPEYSNIENIVWKKSSKEETCEHIDKLIELLQKTDFSSPSSIKEGIWGYAEEKGRGDVLWPMRYALSGKDKSPDPFALAYILDKEETIKRLNTAREKLN